MSFEKYSELKETDKKEFERLANRLLSQCFIIKRENRKDYNFVSRHRLLFQEYFDMTGFLLEENDEYGIFQLINAKGYNHKQFNLNETIALLILRILYDQKKRELSLTGDVIVTPAEIQDHYLAVRKGRNINKTDLYNALTTLRRFHIINYGRTQFDTAFDLSDEDTPILVYDSILLAVPIQNIKEVYEHLEKFKNKNLPERNVIQE